MKGEAAPAQGSQDRSGQRNILTGNINKFPTVLVYRDDNGSLILPSCPFCGDMHIHGGAPGWRISHCRQHSGTYLLKIGGTVQDLDPRRVREP